ncbi:hypothetical protein B0H11DRAFT_2434066 [Mycena galericulata]|nr:hypothetical protein B0H11DRAFT_2434066 [Mycena galericulata]
MCFPRSAAPASFSEVILLTPKAGIDAEAATEDSTNPPLATSRAPHPRRCGGQRGSGDDSGDHGAGDFPWLKNSSYLFIFAEDARSLISHAPFVVISFGSVSSLSSQSRHSLNPVWDEKLLFHVRLTVLDWDKLPSNDYIGEAAFNVRELVADAPRPLPCGDTRHGDAGRGPWRCVRIAERRARAGGGHGLQALRQASSYRAGADGSVCASAACSFNYETEGAAEREDESISALERAKGRRRRGAAEWSGEEQRAEKIPPDLDARRLRSPAPSGVLVPHLHTSA